MVRSQWASVAERAVAVLFEEDGVSGEEEHPRRMLTGLLDAFRDDKDSCEEFFGYLAIHASPQLRADMLEYAATHTETPGAAEYIAWLSHDAEDWIAFRAIRLCGELRLAEAARDLFAIIGPLSRRLEPGAGKPVGVGHALVMQALRLIIGSDDLDEIRQFESQYFEEEDEERSLGVTLGSDMIVCSGDGLVGLEPERFPWRLFDCLDAPPKSVSIAPFAIQAGPVTAEEYDSFCRAIDEQGHVSCHRAEPDNKQHWRNTLGDRRFLPEAPVAGVDWFDAVAFANWRGGRLPTEDEWELAARANDDRLFPWGDTFESGGCRYAANAFGSEIQTIEAWRALLVTVTPTRPECTVAPVGMYEQKHPLGLKDVVGNVWEWTSSSYTRFEPFSPAVRGRAPIELATDPSVLAVIKGGAWSSYADLLVPAYRGKDIVVDRHNEIGFRCACNIPISTDGDRVPEDRDRVSD